jgi:hypothetical protein
VYILEMKKDFCRKKKKACALLIHNGFTLLLFLFSRPVSGLQFSVSHFQGWGWGGYAFPLPILPCPAKPLLLVNNQTAACHGSKTSFYCNCAQQTHPTGKMATQEMRRAREHQHENEEHAATGDATLTSEDFLLHLPASLSFPPHMRQTITQVTPVLTAFPPPALIHPHRGVGSRSHAASHERSSNEEDCGPIQA